MLKYIRKNNKRLLAIFGVLLMIVFIIPSTVKNRRDGSVVAGTIDGKKVYTSDVRQVQQEWDWLNGRVFVAQRVDDGSGVPRVQPVRLAMQLGPYAANVIDAHDGMYFLLVEEAKRSGAAVSEQQLDALFKQVQLHPSLNKGDADVAEYLRERVLRDFLLVKDLYERGASVIKINQPWREYALASSRQAIKLTAVEDSAAAFEQEVAAPTTQQTGEQFAAYRDKSPQTSDSPFGFGYRYPNRVKLQYITIPQEQIRQQVEQSRGEYEWQVEEYRYYLKNKESFAATQPTTMPLAMGPSTQRAATTGPATRPFAEVRGDVHERIVNVEAEKLTSAIQTKIREILAADWVAYERSVSTSAPSGSTMSSVGVPYDSVEYLPRLALEIQKQYKVLPKTASLQDQYLDGQQLSQLPGIGRARVNSNASFAQYAITVPEPFVPEAQKQQVTVLSMYEPSQPLRDAGDSVYFFRSTAAELAHAPASQSEVADRVEKDVRLAAAYEKARQAGTALVEAARQSGLRVAAEAKGQKTLTVGPFVNNTTAAIPGLSLAGPGRDVFLREAFKLLAEMARTGDRHPVALIELPREGKVLAVQLEEVDSLWDAGSAVLAHSEVTEGLREQFARLFETDWYDYDSLVARLKYVPEHPPRQKGRAGEAPLPVSGQELPPEPPPM